MLVELGVLGTVYALKWVYHRYAEHKPKPPVDPVPQLQVPATAQGTPIPLVFGRTRVRAPLLVWMSPLEHAAGETHAMFSVDMLFAVGLGMGSGVTRGNSLAGNKLHNVWWGDRKLPSPGSLPVSLSALRFGQMVARVDELGIHDLRGAYYFHGGWTDQSLVSPPSKIADRWTDISGDSTLIPGLAKQMLVSFVKMPADSLDPYFNQTVADPGAPSSFVSQPAPDTGFIMGQSPSVSTVSMEVSSYGDIVSGVTEHIFSMTQPGNDFGGDADPAECIYDILTGTNGGKLGLSTSLIDMDSFGAASQTLKSEKNGYSRCFDSTREAGEWLEEICAQIDGVPRFNRKTRKVELKLIRPDYDFSGLPRITRQNCRKLTNAGMSGWSNLVNKVRVVYPSRAKDYEDDSESAQNPGNTDGQNTEEVIHYPGCTNALLARSLAEREIGWRSKPMMKLTAHVDRSFLRKSVGDAVVLNWTKPTISSVVFRIAAANHGTLTDNEIILTLVQDANYVWRSSTPQRPDFGLLNENPKI